MSKQGERKEKGIDFDIIKMMGDVSDKITVGEKEYRLYPLSLGKIDLLSKHEKAVNELINFVRTVKDPDNTEAVEKFNEAADSAIEIFHILTSPNKDEEPKPLEADERKALRWSLTMPDVFHMMMFLRMGNVPKEMLKNVRGPGRGAEKEISGNGSQQS